MRKSAKVWKTTKIVTQIIVNLIKVEEPILKDAKADIKRVTKDSKSYVWLE